MEFPGDLDSLNNEMAAPHKLIPTFRFNLTHNVLKIEKLSTL